MTMLYIMAGILLVLVLTQTVLFAYEYFAHDARWPCVTWILLCGALIVDAMILKSESLWFWLRIFW